MSGDGRSGFAVTEVQLNVEPSGGTVACDTESMTFTFRGLEVDMPDTISKKATARLACA